MAVQMENDVFQVYNDSLALCHVRNAADDSLGVTNNIATSDESRYGFSLAMHKNSMIHLTGGFRKQTKWRKKNKEHTCQSTLVWIRGSAKWDKDQTLNKKRGYHGSCYIDNTIYVFAGFCLEDTPGHLKSIEYKPLGKNWQLIDDLEMSERLHPAVTAITRTQIVIMGGESSTGELLSDILILDTNTLSISQAIADSGINFKCESQTIAVEYGCALSFVTVEEYDFQQDDSFSSLSGVADLKPSL